MKKTGLGLEETLKIVNIVVVTRGEKGTSIYAEGKEIVLPVVPPTQIVDPTGVGDAFRGGFLAGYAKGWSWDICGKMGALAATFCLEKKGTQNHTFSTDEFVGRFRKHFSDDGLLDELI